MLPGSGHVGALAGDGSGVSLGVVLARRGIPCVCPCTWLIGYSDAGPSEGAGAGVEPAEGPGSPPIAAPDDAAEAEEAVIAALWAQFHQQLAEARVLASEAAARLGQQPELPAPESEQGVGAGSSRVAPSCSGSPAKPRVYFKDGARGRVGLF